MVKKIDLNKDEVPEDYCVMNLKMFVGKFWIGYLALNGVTVPVYEQSAGETIMRATAESLFPNNYLYEVTDLPNEVFISVVSGPYNDEAAGELACSVFKEMFELKLDQLNFSPRESDD